MEAEIESFSGPFYLLKGPERCWKCSKPCEVVGLAAGDGEPYMLSNIKSMPDEFLMAILALHRDYEFRHSHTAGTSYFMNVCKCGAPFGDFFLFCEPGHAFFPTSDVEARQIEVHELPFEGEYRFDCSAGMGTGGVILRNGKRLPHQPQD